MCNRDRIIRIVCGSRKNAGKNIVVICLRSVEPFDHDRTNRLSSTVAVCCIIKGFAAPGLGEEMPLAKAREIRRSARNVHASCQGRSAFTTPY